jgi:hypothetical protein
VLKRTRDHPEQVRVLAVKALSGILSSTGEEGLSLLPDCLPYLQELLEDGSSLVTEAARLLIKDVEEVLGEVRSALKCDSLPWVPDLSLINRFQLLRSPSNLTCANVVDIGGTTRLR